MHIGATKRKKIRYAVPERSLGGDCCRRYRGELEFWTGVNTKFTLCTVTLLSDPVWATIAIVYPLDGGKESGNTIGVPLGYRE